MASTTQDQPSARALSAIVLAAGHGTRMRSEVPKPIHLLVGKPMVLWVIDALEACRPSAISVVIGHGGEVVRKRVTEDAGDRPVEFVEQTEQRGTGDATMVGLTGLGDHSYDEPEDVLVLTGDTPLLRPSTLEALVSQHRATDAACTVLTAEMSDPTGYGRIVRGREDRVVGIVEQRDCTDEQVAITEINTGIFCFRRSFLAPALRRITTDNAQGELYLTDVVQVLAEAGHPVHTMVALDPEETHGVNDRRQLAAAEGALRQRINAGLMAAGVTLVDPGHTYIDASVIIGNDVTVFPGAILQGITSVGSGSEIGPGCHLVDTVVGDRCRVTATHAVRASVGDAAVVGPYASLGPGDEVASRAVTGPHYAGANTEQLTGDGD